MVQDQPFYSVQRFAAEDGDGGCSPADSAIMALTLFTVWSARTGRVLPPVPIAELTAQQLEDFWADDRTQG
ncbi:hypothetical protein [Actinomadura sp. 9N407]|uniref:hypothetical protein n=1 Tax=Actinomadura sp. 9N407 TaxID=3375154 RepID=UPI0037B5BF89